MKKVLRIATETAGLLVWLICFLFIGLPLYLLGLYLTMEAK
jgi:hypothetical protein